MNEHRYRTRQPLPALLITMLSVSLLTACDEGTTETTTYDPPVTQEGLDAPREVDVANLNDGDGEVADRRTAQVTKDVNTGSAGSEGLVVERMMPEQVYADSQTQYTLRVKNEGDLVFHNVVVHEALSNNFQPQQEGQEMDAEEGDGQQQQMTELMHRVGILAPGESRDITVYGTATGEGQVEACTWVTYNAADCVTFDIVKPELAIDHRFVNAEGQVVNRAYACDDVYLMYSVTNTGSGETPAITINETLPQGLKLAEGSGPIKVDAGTLGAGEKFESEKMLLDLEGSDVSSIRARAVATANNLGEVADGSSLQVMRPELELTVQAPSEEYLGRDVPRQLHRREHQRRPRQASGGPDGRARFGREPEHQRRPDPTDR